MGKMAVIESFSRRISLPKKQLSALRRLIARSLIFMCTGSRFSCSMGCLSDVGYFAVFIQAFKGMTAKLAFRLPPLSNVIVTGSDLASAGRLLIMRWLPPGWKTIWLSGAMVISVSGRIVVPVVSRVVACICTSAELDTMFVSVIASVPWFISVKYPALIRCPGAGSLTLASTKCKNAIAASGDATWGSIGGA